MSSEQRFLTETGPEVFTGNELLVKGALEADGGTHLLGGYPGSPVAGFFDSLPVLKDVLRDKGIRAIINNNEALAAAMLNGSQTLPLRAMIVMKSVGVHVAADGLALGNLAGANRQGGAILVCGDDPWSDSTQVASDSRYICKHLFIPTIEPSNPQEVKDFVDLSYKLSAASELIAGYILTTNLADGGGTVICRPNQYPDVNTHHKVELLTRNINADKRVLLPPRTWWQEESLAERFGRAKTTARKLGLNRLEYPVRSGKAPLGFVAAGLGHDYLVQALFEMGLLGEFPIAKFGLSYPIDEQLVAELAAQCERIVVVEERRGFMEEQIAGIIASARAGGSPENRISASQALDLGALCDIELYGKKFPDGLEGIPAIRGLHPSMLVLLLGPLVRRVAGSLLSDASLAQIDEEVKRVSESSRTEVPKLPTRLASFCPGCPHRDSASLCIDIKRKFADPRYMAKRHGREPVDLLFHGDTGCYTMLMYPPNSSLMHDYSGMGLGGGTGAGTDPFVRNKEVVFMGDSTFYHSGQIAISHAIANGQDITFIILDNSTTAMTGHQTTPGLNYDVLGNPTPEQDIETIIRGITAGTDTLVTRIDPEKRSEYRALLEDAFLADGVKVIISTKECSITRNRRKRRAQQAEIKKNGFLAKREYMNINEEICRFCLACTELTGCPGLRHVQTDYGTKMDTDPTWCVVDGACERVGACDSFEKVIIRRKHKARSRVPELALDEIPEPRKRPVGEIWRALLTGVGGMGIGLATSILVRAGHKEGYEVIFLDKKGLAIRNGGVVSQVIFKTGEKHENDASVDPEASRIPLTGLIGYGKADLLLGVDILEAARVLDPSHRMRVASKDITAAVLNTDKIATISGLMGREDYDPDELAELIRRNTRDEEFLARNISRICEKYLGSKLYANIMMMGYAFQNGLIPVSMHSIAWAIKDSIRVDFKQNLYAFNMGRKLVEQPDLFQGPPVRTGWRETLDERCRFTQRRFGKNTPRADELRELVAQAVERMADLDDVSRRDLVVRAYDTMRWGGIAYARRYVDRVVATYQKDRAEYEFAATKAVLHNLADAMLIKDVVYEAELATSPEKYARDREKYDVNPANGDKITYRHYMKRTFRLFGHEFTWNHTVYDHQLQAIKRMRWLRGLLKPWTRRARLHRSKYEALVDGFGYDSADSYRMAVQRLSSPSCMQCMDPACSTIGCPAGADIPEWMSLNETGKVREACDLLHEKNNFPEFTALICPAFCQSACHRGLQRTPVAVREAEGEIVERGFAAGWVKPQPAKEKSGKSVGIVGSGPAGLAAAQQLARAGHDVTVYERDEKPGGLLRYGIPEHRLGAEKIDRRLEQLAAEGVTFACGQGIDDAQAARALREKHDAVLLAVGATEPRELPLPRPSDEQVVQALDFLRQPVDVAGKTVVVIGAGLTGEDCVEKALTAGAKCVHHVDVLPKPAASQSLPGAPVDDRVQQHWSVAVKALLGESRLTGLSVVKVRYTPSSRGPVREEVADGGQEIPADLVVLAMGFDPVLPPALAEGLDVAVDEAGKVLTDDQYATGAPGVFVAGDCVIGPSYVITAIDSARRAAARIDRYLGGPDDAA